MNTQLKVELRNCKSSGLPNQRNMNMPAMCLEFDKETICPTKGQWKNKGGSFRIPFKQSVHPLKH